MLRIIQYVEQTVVSFDHNLTLILGLAGVLIGLFLWLGGLGLTRSLAIVTGAAGGAVAGYILTEHDTLFTILAAFAGMVIALVVERILRTIFGTSFIFGRLIPAVVFAMVGTILIFAGMTSLLIFKGTHPDRLFGTRQAFYDTTFGVMAVFGSLTQLMLCPRIREKLAQRKLSKKPKPQTKQETVNWRTR